jgi:hypothetical protein
MNKSQAFGSFLSLATFSFVVTSATLALAEFPPCRNENLPIGSTCYTDLDINARSGPDDASSDHDETTAGKGYSIIDWSFRNDAQFGSVEGPKYTFTEKGSAYEMKNSIDEYTRNLEEVRKKAEAEGNGSKYLADYIDKTLKEYENRRSAVSSAQTNVDVLKVDVTVRGRCLKSTPFGCVDKGGGKLQGVVRVYKRYIGTPEATQTFLTETLSKAREIAASANSNPTNYEDLTRQLYRQILSREPDPSGFRDNVNAMRQNSFEWVRAGMAGSQESRNNINNIYRQYLCRDADPGGMDVHINLLASGQMALDQIRNGIANGAEAQQHKNGCR